MSAAAFALVLMGALAILAVVLNHCYARIALVELALNEGLPPGHAVERDESARRASQALPPGAHVFLSRSCYACQRLLDELGGAEYSFDADVYLHYVDRPRPEAAAIASRLNATLRDREQDLARSVAADPLPFTIAIGPHNVVNAMVTPTVNQLAATVRDAGISVTQNLGARR